MYYTVDDLPNLFPTVKKENEYVLILNKGTVAEKIYSSYDSEMEAFKVGKTLQGKKSIIKANVTYLLVDDLPVLHDYEEIEKNKEDLR